MTTLNLKDLIQVINLQLKMNNKTINKVRVTMDFPGYKEGDILELDSNAGLFHFTNTTQEDGAKGDSFDIFAARITGEIKPSITKKEILSYMGTLFADISTYKVRSYGELNMRIDEIKAQMQRVENDETINTIDTSEALTVWQNMLWEYEWIMGMRDLYHFTTPTNWDYTDPTGEPKEVIRENQEQIPDGDFQGFIDGNALESLTDKEEVQNESTSTDKVREDC